MSLAESATYVPPRSLVSHIDQSLDQNYKYDAEHRPDDDGNLDGERLLLVGMLKALVVAEEAPLVRLDRRGGKHVDVGHGKDEDDETDNLEAGLERDVAAGGGRHDGMLESRGPESSFQQ